MNTKRILLHNNEITDKTIKFDPNVFAESISVIQEPAHTIKYTRETEDAILKMLLESTGGEDKSKSSTNHLFNYIAGGYNSINYSNNKEVIVIIMDVDFYSRNEKDNIEKSSKIIFVDRKNQEINIAHYTTETLSRNSDIAWSSNNDYIIIEGISPHQNKIYTRKGQHIGNLYDNNDRKYVKFQKKLADFFIAPLQNYIVHNDKEGIVLLNMMGDKILKIERTDSFIFSFHSFDDNGKIININCHSPHTLDFGYVVQIARFDLLNGTISIKKT